MLDLQSRLAQLEKSRNNIDGSKDTYQNNSQDFCSSDEFFNLKNSIHEKLAKTINLALLEDIDEAVLKDEISQIADKLLIHDKLIIPINLREREILINEIFDEVVGLGPLDPLLKDPSVSDILVNRITSYNVCYTKLLRMPKPMMS